jgi:Calx-beta domain-containing protein/collagen triple helix repeat protein/List-Bact-rpt repeat protein
VKLNRPIVAMASAAGAGCPGPQGPQGPQGLEGPRGVAGPQGQQGPQGAQGIQGAPGPQGAQGQQGPAGPQGTAGSQGSAGPQGPSGPAGTNGAQGPQGPPGPTNVFGLTVHTQAGGFDPSKVIDTEVAFGGDEIRCGAAQPDVDCTEVYPTGTVVTLYANPANKKMFGGWTGDCSGYAPTCTLTMDRDRTVGASFGTPSLTINDVSVSEATGIMHFTVTLDPPFTNTSETIQVTFTTADGSATSTPTATRDYQATGGTLTFNPGQTTKTIDVAIADDALPESDETFSVRLTGVFCSSSQGNPCPEGTVNMTKDTGTGTITNDD